MGVSKVTLDGTTLMDLTDVTVTPEHLVKNETAHDNKGDAIIGSARPNYEIELLNHTYSGAYVNNEIASIGERAFNNNTALTSVSCLNVEQLGTYCFNGCTNLLDVSMPKVTSISNYAFCGCSKLEEITTSDVTDIYQYAFDGCTNLENLNKLQSTSRIGDYAFRNCKSLVSISFPNLTGSSSTDYKHGTNMFEGCSALVSAYLENAGYLRNKGGMFKDCTALTTVNLKKMTAYYGQNLFYNCQSLPLVVLPKINGGNANYNMCTNWFYNCISLHSVDIGNPYAIQTKTFSNASIFSTFIIRGARTTTLNNIDAFTGTPFAEEGTGGTLYVPQSKIADYEVATNWSTILGYTNNSIKAIEGSYYETHYADGTEISSD